jgi:hypothetical protein
MSNPRVDPSTSGVQVDMARSKTTSPEPVTPFSKVLASGANVLVAGASVASGLVGGPVLAAVVREAGNGLVSAAAGAGGGGGGGGAAGSGAAAVAAGAGGQGSEISQMYAMQRESQAFNLQLLNLQQDVQDENRRFTTVSNCLKAAHDTAKQAVNNMHA